MTEEYAATGLAFFLRGCNQSNLSTHSKDKFYWLNITIAPAFCGKKSVGD